MSLAYTTCHVTIVAGQSDCSGLVDYISSLWERKCEYFKEGKGSAVPDYE